MNIEFLKTASDDEIAGKELGSKRGMTIDQSIMP